MLIARIFTLYPEFFPGPLGKGLYGKALAEKIWKLETVNIRDYATDKHKTVDDTTYGGGSGMLIKPDVLANSLDKNLNSKEKIIHAIKELNGSLQMLMSVQSMDPVVLKNIRRDNISLDQMMGLIPAIKEVGLSTMSECILGLPGETFQSHVDTLRNLVRAKIDNIQVFTCMMLPGSELATPEERKKWNLETRFRILPRDFTKLKNGNVHPPKKKITNKVFIKIILLYSAKKNIAKNKDEYSTLYPATSSDSASGKSNGARLVSAKIEQKNIR